MSLVVSDSFRINFKMLPYYDCTSHWKLWYWAIIWILFFIYVVVCVFIFLYNFLGNKCSCWCSNFTENSSAWTLTGTELCTFPSTYQGSSDLLMGSVTWSHPFLLVTSMAGSNSGNKRHNFLKHLSSSERLHMRNFSIVGPSLQASCF